MTVSSSTNRVSYSGNGTLTVFAYTFKVFDEADLTVILRASDGTETVQTITTHYTVSGVGDAGGGNVTFVTAPTATQTVVILREQPLTQGLDLVPNDPFPAASLEDALDKLVFMSQKHEEELSRAIKASRTNTISTTEFTDSSTDRASKIIAFDTSGNLDLTQEVGVYRGDWSASVSYNQRDLVKDTSNNNIYLANTAHTSSGTTPLSSNADIAKWDLIVDAAAASTSASAAATSATAAQTAQTAAETAQTAAETAQTAAETAETNAETAQTAAEAAQASAESVYDNFDDRYLGAKSTSGGDPTLDNDGDALIDGALFFDTTNNVMKVYNLGTTTWLRTTPTTSDQADITTLADIDADIQTLADIEDGTLATSAIQTVASQITPTNNVSTLAGISSEITTVSGISSSVTAVAGDTANIGTVATNLTGTDTIGTVATSISNVNSVGGSIASVNSVASNLGTINDFAARYRVQSGDPTTSLDLGDLYFDTATDALKIYTSTGWQAGVTAGSGFLSTTGGTLTGDLSGTNITLSGYLRGPSTFTIDPATHGDDTGTVVIAGNLQVDGTQTTINSTTMTVDDLNITVASGAANAAAADGAGITVDGANATITYNSTGDNWGFNKPISLGTWTVTESGGALYFAVSGVNKMKLDSSGNLDVVGNVNTNATIS